MERDKTYAAADVNNGIQRSLRANDANPPDISLSTSRTSSTPCGSISSISDWMTRRYSFRTFCTLIIVGMFESFHGSPRNTFDGDFQLVKYSIIVSQSPSRSLLTLACRRRKRSALQGYQRVRMSVVPAPGHLDSPTIHVPSA